MENFSYFNPVKLISGIGAFDHVAEEILPYGNRVLLVYGQKHIRETGVYDRIMEQFKKAGITTCELPGVRPNPKVDLIRQGIEICKHEAIDFILGIGGGSVCDSVKAIGMGAKVDYDIWEMFENYHHMMHGEKGEDRFVPKEMLPIGVVMTKAGTGSEFDYTSVVSNPETQEKLMVINKVMYPKFSVHDPTLLATLPRPELAFGTADIMTHILEQYFTLSKDTENLDRYKEAGLKTVIDAGQRVMRDPEDLAAQSYLEHVAAWACSDFSMSGAAGGWAAHMIEHEITAITDLNHGNGMAIVFPTWMEYVLDVTPEKFAQYGERVWGIERKGRGDREVGRDAIQQTVAFWTSLGIPLKLNQVHIGGDILPRMASQAVRFGPLFSLKNLQDGDVLNILQMAQ